MSQVSQHEPPPEPGEQIVLHAVIADLEERAEVGKEKYGTYLMTNNGRDALLDAIAEAEEGKHRNAGNV